MPAHGMPRPLAAVLALNAEAGWARRPAAECCAPPVKTLRTPGDES